MGLRHPVAEPGYRDCVGVNRGWKGKGERGRGRESVRAREREGIEDDCYSGTWVRRGRERESERDRAGESERTCVVCV